jgi:hypothetical protein
VHIDEFAFPAGDNKPCVAIWTGLDMPFRMKVAVDRFSPGLWSGIMQSNTIKGRALPECRLHLYQASLRGKMAAQGNNNKPTYHKEMVKNSCQMNSKEI